MVLFWNHCEEHGRIFSFDKNEQVFLMLCIDFPTYSLGFRAKTDFLLSIAPIFRTLLCNSSMRYAKWVIYSPWTVIIIFAGPSPAAFARDYTQSWFGFLRSRSSDFHGLSHHFPPANPTRFLSVQDRGFVFGLILDIIRMYHQIPKPGIIMSAAHLSSLRIEFLRVCRHHFFRSYHNLVLS